MPTPRLNMLVNYKLLFTTLALILFPRHLTFLSLLTIFLRLILIPATSPATSPAATGPVTTVLDNLGKLLLRSTVLVLCLHSSIQIVKMGLLWCARNIDAPAARSWSWICIALGEVVVLVCRLLVCLLLYSLQYLFYSICFTVFA